MLSTDDLYGKEEGISPNICRSLPRKLDLSPFLSRTIPSVRLQEDMDPQLVASHVIKLLGGRDKALAHFDADVRLLNARWDQDTDAIGRILRAHLFVEHFLTEYLVARNPALGPLEDARLTFAQKLALIGEATGGVAYLAPGIRRLNTIRNRLAHSLSAEITPDDINVFLGIVLFKAMRDELAKPNQASADPMDILEDFSRHTGSALHASATRNDELWAEAIKLAEAETEAAEAT